MNCSSDLKNFANSWPSALNLKFSQSLKQFFLTVGQNNFGNKIPFSDGEKLLKFEDHQSPRLFHFYSYHEVRLRTFFYIVLMIYYFFFIEKNIWKCQV